MDKSQVADTVNVSAQRHGGKAWNGVHFLEAGMSPVALESHQLASARKRHNQTVLLRNTISGNTVEEELEGIKRQGKNL